MAKHPCVLLALLPACALLATPAPAAPAAKQSTIEKAGTATAIAMPIVAGGIALMHNRDWTGVAQMAVSTATTVGTALILKQVVREQRPDHSDFQSFPSDTAALADAPAFFLWRRYGWEYGVPATMAAAFVSYSRVDAQKHHWYDVAASGALAAGFNFAFVREYQRPLGIYAEANPDGVGLRVALTW